MRGSLVPLVTPFRDGRIDDGAVVNLIEWQIESGTHGIGVCGTTGEPAALSVDEREHVIELAVRTARKRVPFSPAPGR